MVLLAHSQESAAAYDRKYDVVGQVVENDIIDLTDLLTGGFLRVGSIHFPRMNCLRMASGTSHGSCPRGQSNDSRKRRSSGMS